MVGTTGCIPSLDRFVFAKYKFIFSVSPCISYISSICYTTLTPFQQILFLLQFVEEEAEKYSSKIAKVSLEKY